jgi:sugar O-acyltransferase (sialic acid O-acetyltransferase NeuD family)
MIIIGAKGLAKELLQMLESSGATTDLAFFDDVNLDMPNLIFAKYPVLKAEEEVLNHFNSDNRFMLGLGNPNYRLKLYERFVSFGGELVGLKGNNVNVGNYVTIGEGATFMDNVNISNGVQIGKGLLAYYNTIITHDVEIGDFVELSPSSTLLGHVKIGNQAQIGAGAIILPRLQIGTGAVIGAGAVVTKNVEPNTVVAGNPAKVIKK